MSEITDYQLVWHATAGGAIRIKKSGAPWSAWRDVSHESLAAFAAMARHEPLLLDSAGRIRTAPSEPGEVAALFEESDTWFENGG